MVCKTLNEFEKRWKEKCSKIEKSELNENQAGHIADRFLDEIIVFHIKSSDKEAQKNGVLLINEIFNDVNLALQIAISNYKKRHGVSFRDKIFGVKNFHMDFNAVKNVINQ